MKTNLKLHAAIIGVIFLLLSISVNAQSRETMKVNIPFEFTVAGDVFEAGDYTIERFNPQQRSVLILKSVDGNSKRILLTNEVKTENIVENAKLVFTKIAGSYFLSQVWVDSGRSGLELVKSKAERKTERLAKLNKEKIMVVGID